MTRDPWNDPPRPPATSGALAFSVAPDAGRWAWFVWPDVVADRRRPIPAARPAAQGSAPTEAEARAAARAAVPAGSVVLERPASARLLLERRAKARAARAERVAEERARIEARHQARQAAAQDEPPQPPLRSLNEQMNADPGIARASAELDAARKRGASSAEQEPIRQRLYAAYAQFFNLAPPPAQTTEHVAALAVLGLRTGASADEVRGAYRQAARQHHPDVGGDAARFIEATRAKDVLLRALEPRAAE